MKIKISIAAGIFVTLSFLVIFWQSYHWDSLPRIKDAEQLRNDCVRLCEEFPLPALNTNQMLFKQLNDTNTPDSFRGRFRQTHFREIPQINWPSSIQKLHPFRVLRDEYAISIWVVDNSRFREKQNWLAKGYYVHTNPSNPPPRSATHGFGMYYLHETKHEGIDVFVLPDAVL